MIIYNITDNTNKLVVKLQQKNNDTKLEYLHPNILEFLISNNPKTIIIQCLDNVINLLPDNIEHIIIDRHSYIEIRQQYKFPKNLINLEINDNIRILNNLPDGIINLKINHYYSLCDIHDILNLPPSLKNLNIHFIKQYSGFINKYNDGIKKNININFPYGLETLKLYNVNNDILHNLNNLPTSLKNLYIELKFNYYPTEDFQNIFNQLPDSIEDLSISNDNSITKIISTLQIKKLPKNIQTINFYRNYEFFNECIFQIPLPIIIVKNEISNNYINMEKCKQYFYHINPNFTIIESIYTSN